MALNCCDTDIDGVTGHDVKLVDPAITGGTMAGTVFAKDCQGADVKGGDSVATCADLSAAAVLKQDQLMGVNGLPLPAAACVMTCTEVDQAIAGGTGGKQDALVNCCLAPIEGGTPVVTCEELEERLKDITVGTVTFTDCRGIVLPPNTSIATCADVAGLQGALRDCSGAWVPPGTSVALCSDLDDIIAGHLTLVDCNGATLPIGSAVVSCNNLIDRLTPYQLALTSCSGDPLPAGTRMATCADLEGLEDGLVLYDCNQVMITSGATVVTCDNLATRLEGYQPAVLDCSGLPIPAGTRIATCADLEGLKDGLILYDCSETLITSGTRIVSCIDLSDRLEGYQPALLDCYNQPVSAGESIVTCADLSARLDGYQEALVDCSQEPIDAGTPVATCADLSAAIEGVRFSLAVEGGGPLYGSGVEGDALIFRPSADGAAPDDSEMGSITTICYGGRDVMLGKPDHWMPVTLANGESGVIPIYLTS